jgi:hypothetical protein
LQPFIDYLAVLIHGVSNGGDGQAAVGSPLGGRKRIMVQNRSLLEAFHQDRQYLRSLGVTARAARTALTLILTTVTHFQAVRRWSDEECVYRFRKIVDTIWEVFPIPEVWESISSHRFETGGARDGFKAALFRAIGAGIACEVNPDEVVIRRRPARPEPDEYLSD